MEKKIKGSKLNKEKLTVICANASGIHTLKLLDTGKSKCPRALKRITSLPASYYSSKNRWMNQHLFTERFIQEFVTAQQKCSHKLGKSDSKCLLLLDNFRVHPHETKLVSLCGNVSVQM